MEFSLLDEREILDVFEVINNGVKKSLDQIEYSHMNCDEKDFVRGYVTDKVLEYSDFLINKKISLNVDVFNLERENSNEVLVARGLGG